MSSLASWPPLSVLPGGISLAPALVKTDGAKLLCSCRSTARVSCAGSSNGSVAKESAYGKQQAYGEDAAADKEEGGSEWSKDEIEAISALFARPMRQKPVKPPNPATQRPLPLPLPHKTRPPVTPTPTQHIRLASRSMFSDKVRKNPEVLVGIAKEIAAPDRKSVV